MALLFLFFVLRVALRRDWIAGVALATCWIAIPAFGLLSQGYVSALALAALDISLLVFILVRFGVLAAIAGFFVGTVVHGSTLLTLDPSNWYFGYSTATLLVTVAIAAWAFWISLAGRPLFNDEAPA